MKNILPYNIILFFLLINFAQATVSITETKEWKTINSEILKEENPENTLLIFDIDKTLLHFHEDCQEKNFFKKVFNCEVVTTEKKLPEYFKNYQKQGFPILISTARNGIIIDKSIESVKDIGLDHHSAFHEEVNAIYLAPEDYPEFKLSKKGPYFKKGILFNGLGNAKDQSLQALLELTGQNYEKYIFVDDNYKNAVDSINGLHSKKDFKMKMFYYTRYIDDQKAQKGLEKIQEAFEENSKAL